MQIQFLLMLLLVFSCKGFCQQTVIYPRPESTEDVRSSYPVALLQKCERKNPHLISLTPSMVRTQQGRSLRLVSEGKHMDIVWALTDTNREKALLPIRIPIDRGLIGWRLLLIKSTNQARFENISNQQELAELLAGQGHDWPDVDILRANHFTVASSSSYQGLFHMLARNHIEYFPRAISEVWPELEAHSSLGIQVQDKLVIYYPSALYFFVNKNNHWLAGLLENCLVESTNDGSLKAIFDEYYLDFINRSNLQNRIILRLENPLLPDATPLNKKDYWFAPEEYF